MLLLELSVHEKCIVNVLRHIIQSHSLLKFTLAMGFASGENKHLTHLKGLSLQIIIL